MLTDSCSVNYLKILLGCGSLPSKKQSLPQALGYLNEMLIIVYIAHDQCFSTSLNDRVEVAVAGKFMSVCLFEKHTHWPLTLSIRGGTDN